MNLTISHNITGMESYNALYDVCLTKKGFYSAECMYRNICTSFNNQFIRSGIILIIIYILVMWGLYFLNKTWYKRIAYFNDKDRLIYWNDWIKTRFLNVFLIYIAMYVFFNLNIENLDIIILKYRFLFIFGIIGIILIRLFLGAYFSKKE